MRRFWWIAAALGLGLCALAVAATGCGDERGRKVEVIHERPERERRVEHERDGRDERGREGRDEPERRGDEHDRDRERDREHH
jgi:hypothetical protein